MDAAGQRVDADAITFELALLAAEGGGASKEMPKLLPSLAGVGLASCHGAC